MTYENFVKALQNTTQLRTSLGAQENGTSQENNVNTVARKRRSVQSSLQPPLYSVVSDSMVFVFKSSADPEENLFEASKLKTVCAMDSGIVRSSPSFESQCYNFNDGSKTQCYASWSLGNYVALLNNRVSCQDVTDEDVLKVKNLLQNCSSYFVKQTLKADCEYPDASKNETVSSNCPSVPARCIKYSAVYNIFQYLVDNQFMGTPDDALLKYTLTMLPVPHDLKSFYDEMYNRLKDSIHVRDGVELATFRFWRYKYKKFSEELFVEIIFPALALLVVFCVMWFYLGSFILTFCGLFCIIYASGLSYFLYNIVFGMDFFPFLNVLTLVFLVGIGADDAFVYCDIWRQTRAANPNANIMQLTLKTLRYSALSMLVTSLTTASAFFAGVSSTITAIKCFGIFAGTSILTNYLLMITYFPAVVALHEKWVMKYSEGRSLDVPTSIELAAEKTGAEVAAPIAQDMSESREASNGDHNTQEESGSHKTQKKTSFCILQIIDFPCSLAVSALGVTQRFSSKVFGRWLPIIVIKFHWIWITLLVCLTAGFLCVNFVKPGLQLPESDEFQTFASSHTLENYNLNYKSFFRFEQDGTMSVELIWGIKPADNGNFLDPDNKGSLEFDESFGDLFTKDGQKFLRSLCTSVEKQSFFAAFVGNVGCPIEGLITACTSGPNPCCGKNATFPFPPDVTEKCLLAFASTGQDSGVLFDAESGKIKGFRMVIYTKQSFTTAFSIIDELFKEVDSWVKTEMPKAPPGLRNGWAGSWGFNFYGLQIGLSQGTYSSLGISVAVSFIVMLLTTLNIFISIYAIITIIGIIAITIGSLVLAGWQLNILESIVMSVAVGLSIDFTMHYGVAYRLAPDKSRRENRVRYSLVHIGSAITMAALTTFLTGRVFLSRLIKTSILNLQSCSNLLFLFQLPLKIVKKHSQRFLSVLFKPMMAYLDYIELRTYAKTSEKHGFQV